ncbi:ovomucoid-like [Canis lupus familiaris]|uniref:ovomucoid-like n=1 Tax=Canis lupus familiaris TaxID=9615 RepID=UPI0003ADB7D6|nr:ovomucoid-like [Canis lupus familiaris]XP_038391031.1 ovomucoid-like [Canis lupus familiaris]XP_038519636.1 ovomucoid-like [Canis lupus familiaris]
MKTFFVAILATGYFSYIFGDHLFKDIQCSYYQKTFIQRKQTCSIRVSPLCASNNVTYSNSCVYCFANIALKLTLRIQHSGKCRNTRKVWNMT